MGITPIRIGDLRHRITLQTLALTSDGQGGQTEAWADLATVWAYVKPISANERLYAQKLEPLITHRVTIRYRTDVTSEMRFTYEGRKFQIKAPYSLDERKAFLVFDAQEDSQT